MELFIAYKNYSSWSLRPWLAMKVAGLAFEETIFPFYHDTSLTDFAKQEAIPASVPILKVDNQIVWDSMAIMEVLADTYPEANLWPKSKGWRALARSASAEMHSGFMGLRSQFPMNCRRQTKVTANAESLKDISRLAALWKKFYQADEVLSASRSEGPFLCGAFSIVDAMYAPVMWRIRNYGLSVSDEFDAWSEAMFALPAMQEWLRAAQEEEWEIAAYDAVE
ncbi:glutathione S-transferase [Marinomonas sp. PE14-40]|uniref:glutathione S-transferase n=1 Tax=Marinomonas sp. PE14-40 TaxID=3060621 RepID=UPI003F661DD2